jgi:hypothetical protein
MTDSIPMEATTTGTSLEATARRLWESALQELVPEAWTEEPIGNSVEEPSSTSIALLLPTQCNVKDLIRNVSFSWVGASERRDSYLWEAVPTVAQQTQMAAAEYWLLTKELDKQDPRPKLETPGLIPTLEEAKELAKEAGLGELEKKLGEAKESATKLAKRLEKDHGLVVSLHAP